MTRENEIRVGLLDTIIADLTRSAIQYAHSKAWDRFEAIADEVETLKSYRNGLENGEELFR